ncbi:hypothetical protein OQA88_10455 [Cercophora sp. LCS_1]
MAGSLMASKHFRVILSAARVGDAGAGQPQDGGPSFLRFPPEIRNRIYHLLFDLDGAIIDYDSQRHHRSGQFLRTCHEVFIEGAPILWGTGTWRITIKNTGGPGYARHDNSMKYAWQLEPAVTYGWQTSRPGRSIQGYGRRCAKRFSLDIEFTEHYDINLIRSGIRRAYDLLNDSAEIEHLAVSLDNRGNWDRSWDPHAMGYYDTGDATEVDRFLEIWLGRLRNVKNATFKGISSDCAEVLIQEWQSTDPVDPLPAMYTTLERYVKDMKVCKSYLRSALVATEKADYAGFVDLRDQLVKQMQAHVEQMVTGIYRNDPTDWRLVEDKYGV